MTRSAARVIDATIVDEKTKPSQALATQSNPYLGMVQQLVAAGGDMSNLDKMLDLQLKWEANEARKAYVAAMASFKAEPMEILKRKTVRFQTNDGKTTEYTHAELSDVTDAVVPAMGKHGLSHRWDVKQENGQITVACTITHALGHSESVSLTAAPDQSGKKNLIQQVASAVTYLQRYTLLALTGMATKGIDDDGRAGGGQGEEEEPTAKDQDWCRTADQIDDPLEYEQQRDKMLADYGSVNSVPRAVRIAFNTAKIRVTPRDEE